MITAYKINNQTILAELSEWSESDLSGNTAFKIENSVSSGYTDISSIKSYVLVGKVLGKDYKWIRRQLQDYIWSSVTSEDQIILAQYKSTSEENCKTSLGEEYVKWMSDFDLKSQECRNTRLANAKSILFANISIYDRFNIL